MRSVSRRTARSVSCSVRSVGCSSVRSFIGRTARSVSCNSVRSFSERTTRSVIYSGRSFS